MMLTTRFLFVLVFSSSFLSAAEFYVAPDGSSSGDGSRERPWDLATALKHPASVGPGDTIWLRGGIYRGKFESRLRGRSGGEIVIRSHPGEWAVIDRDLANVPERGVAMQVNGAWAVYRDFEVRDSSARQEQSSGVGTGGGINVTASNDLKFINLIIHNVSGQGLAVWSDNVGAEIYGCLIYYNGGNRYDHGVYTQNREGIKRYENNIVFGNSGHGFHVYGSDRAYLNNFHLKGNTAFNNGSILRTRARNILVGGGAVAKNPVIEENCTYFSGWTGESGRGVNNLGYSGGCSEARVLNNYFAGAMALEITARHEGAGCEPVEMTGNVFVGGTDGFETLQYAGNQYLSSSRNYPNPVPANRILVSHNRYERGRGHITVYNWSREDVVEADISGLGLEPGETYKLRNAQDYFGDVVVGRYEGARIRIQMTGRTVARPVNFETPPSNFPEFGAFIVRRTSPEEKCKP